MPRITKTDPPPAQTEKKRQSGETREARVVDKATALLAHQHSMAKFAEAYAKLAK